MTVHLDWPPDVVERLTRKARQQRLSLNAYHLRKVLREKVTSGAPLTASAVWRRLRHDAAARILEIQKRVKLDPEGWTFCDYVNYGRR